MNELFLVSRENIIVVNLHDLQVLEAELELDRTIQTVTENIQAIVAIHGYRKGEAILNMIKYQYRNKRVIKKVPGSNRGITILLLDTYKG